MSAMARTVYECLRRIGRTLAPSRCSGERICASAHSSQDSNARRASRSASLSATRFSSRHCCSGIQPIHASRNFSFSATAAHTFNPPSERLARMRRLAPRMVLAHHCAPAPNSCATRPLPETTSPCPRQIAADQSECGKLERIFMPVLSVSLC